MSLLPFRTGNTKGSESALKYELKLEEYKIALENYKKWIHDYSDKLESSDKRLMDNQLAMVQTALDLTYIRNQGDKTVELLEEMRSEQERKVLIQLENLMAAIAETNYKLGGLDKDVVKRVSEIYIELQKQTMIQYKQFHNELSVSMESVSKSVKSNRSLLWFLISLNIIGLGGLAYLILVTLEVLPF